MLPGCLDSVKGVVDQVVVVDTGSSDRTPELARRAGAQVVPFAWREDFAAARNASLAAARGEWVLVLDADERLAPGAGRALREAVRRHDAAPLGVLPLHHASRLDASCDEVLSGRARLGEPTELHRLLRRTPDLAYEGLVHEHVDGWLGRHGRKGMRVAAPIVHYGAVPELRRERGKDVRNQTLLRRLAESDPTDLDASGYLAMELYTQGDYQGALAVVEERWPRRHGWGSTSRLAAWRSPGPCSSGRSIARRSSSRRWPTRRRATAPTRSSPSCAAAAWKPSRRVSPTQRGELVASARRRRPSARRWRRGRRTCR